MPKDLTYLEAIREALLEEMQDGDKGGDDEPEKPARGRGRAKQSEPKPASPPADSNGVITITREQILTALTEGEVEIEV